MVSIEVVTLGVIMFLVLLSALVFLGGGARRRH